MERIDIAGISIETWAAGDGPPLLFLHGIDYFAQHKPFLDRLARRFRVIAPRHPGFGATPRPAWFRTVGDIACLYLDLMDRLALRDVLLVGASFGGWVAMELAVRSCERLSRLALIDTLGAKFGRRDEAEIADIYVLSADEAVRRTFADPARAPDHAAMSDAAVEEVARDREAAVLYGWKPYMHNPSLVHWLHRIKRPTLIVWGQADRIVAPAYGAHLVQKFERAQFVPIADAGHYPAAEQPEAVARQIEAFAQN
jgi:pimeloyl-ACP methyl ester carboxylesterase